MGSTYDQRIHELTMFYLDKTSTFSGLRSPTEYWQRYTEVYNKFVELSDDSIGDAPNNW